MKTLRTTFHALTCLTFAALAMVGCKEDGDEVAVTPRVVTTEVTGVTFSSAILGGSITSTGGAGIKAKGICFGVNPVPTVEDDTTNLGSGSASFVSSLTELLPNTTYYARAYATNQAGTSYGEEFSFITQTGLPEVTLEISNVTFKKALGKLTILSVGGSSIGNSGFVYSKENPAPTLDDNIWSSFSDALTVELQFTELPIATTYYVRAFAQNDQGLVYSDMVQFTTKGIPVITDIDGNQYTTILVGDQAWMTENLRVTRYNNGDAIATTLADVSGEDTPKYQWTYNNDDANVPVYGRYYTHFALADERKVCPAGTHVPSADEMTNMLSFLGNDGGKYKQTGTTTWKAPNTGATNTNGFNAAGAGYRSLYGSFLNFQEYSFFLTSTESSATTVKGFYLGYNLPSTTTLDMPKKSGFSVRCVVD